MRAVEQHLAECLRAVSPLAAIELPLLEAADCVLTEDVRSSIDLPLFDNSSMDGYAVRTADVSGAGPERPVRLPVVADVPAGHAEPLRLVPGAAIRIMTGAPLPAAADAVVPVEWTDGGVGRVEVRRAPVLGQFVRRSGEDVRAGATVVRSGTRLSARDVALLAAVGRERALVRPRPRVAVLSSGSELVPPGQPLRPGQIHDANGYGLAAAAAELGARVHRVGIVPDDPRAVLEVMQDQVSRADMILTSGGVSAGAYDTIKEVLRGLGTVEFVKVAMQPGMPQGLGTIGPDGTPIFTLPGNPVSALISFEVFVRPALRKMWGESALHRRTAVGTVLEGWSSPPGKRQFTRAKLSDGSHGERLLQPVGGQGSHLVADLADATCLAVVPEDVTEVKPGDMLRCLLLERERW